MKTYSLIVIILLLFSIPEIKAQSSLKRAKQVHRFHYLQANFHMGVLNGDRFDMSDTGPKNRLVYQYFSKNQRLMQKGYVKYISLSSFRSRVSLDFVGGMQSESPMAYQLKLQNVGFNFATKWDRTSFFVGYSNIRFGHNPKIDPVTAFTANSLSLDLGFTQDLGVSFKTALSKKYDFEAALYSGGVFRSPLVSFSPEMMQEQGKDAVEFINPEYNGSWLGTARVGSPLFNSFEYGAFVMAGKTGVGSNERNITRIGIDAVKKVGEKMKFENQIHGGMNSYENGESTFDAAWQTNMEFYINGSFIISTSNAILFVIPEDENEEGSKGVVINSVSYVVSPHTRVRLNQFYNYGNLVDNNWGVTLQLVTGIGKR